MKKKLDFYLATGKLPPVAKSSLQNGIKDTSQPTATQNLICSNKDSDSAAQTSSGTTDIGKPDEEGGKDLLEPSALVPDMATSSSIRPNESMDSEGLECNPESPNIDLTCSESMPRLENCTVNCEFVEDGVTGTQKQVGTPTYGSLYYVPPQLKSSILLDKDTSSKYSAHHDYNTSPVASPISFFTPPCVKGSGLSSPSPESILKIAAKTFPYTPSIFRKRKPVVQAQLDANKIGKVDGETGSGRFRLSGKRESNKNDSKNFRFQDASPSGSIEPTRMTFNASPPYRLRSKRTAVFKSVERQLEFTSNKDKRDGNSESVKPSVQGTSPDTEDCLHATKRGVT